MIDVIEINPTDGEIPQLFDGRGAFDVSEHGRLRFERKWNKAAEPTGFILKPPKLPQMVDAMFERLNVTIEHRAGAAPTHLMPGSVDIKPFFGRLLPTANAVAHGCVKNFRAAAGNGSQSVFAQ